MVLNCRAKAWSFLFLFQILSLKTGQKHFFQEGFNTVWIHKEKNIILIQNILIVKNVIMSLVYLISEQALISDQVLNSKVLPARFLITAYVGTNEQGGWGKCLKTIKRAYSAISQMRVSQYEF